MKYIHCSWDILEPDSLVPRVPETIITGPNLTEDSKTPRICVTGSVQDALKSITLMIMIAASMIIAVQKTNILPLRSKCTRMMEV